MTVTITHSTVTGAAANPNVLVDGPKWDANHAVTGLENVDNTSDVNKPVSTATQAALDAKASINFTQTGTGAVTRTVSSKLGDIISVKDFGAVGNGVTNDSVAIQAACDECYARGGGVVYLPPTGAAYICSNINVSNGVHIRGARSKVYPGSTATVAQWTASGTWVRSTDTTNPTFNLSGNGSGITGVCFIRTQPVPSGVSFTPTTFPYEIKITGTFFTVDDITTVGTTNDIWIAFTSGSGGGTFCRITNLNSGALTRGIKFENVNDTMYIANIHHRINYYSSDSRVVTWMEANKIDWDIGYLDNPMVDGVEFFRSYLAMQFTDQTCVGNTHSLYNGTFKNIQFNLVRQGMKCAAIDTTVRFEMANCVAQTDTETGVAATLFDLGSDNVIATIGNMIVNDAGLGVLKIGNGVGGKALIDTLLVINYDANGLGSNCFTIGANATIYIGNKNITGSGTAGAVVGGTGTLSNLVYSASPTFTGTLTAAAIIGTSSINGQSGVFARGATTTDGYIGLNPGGASSQGYLGFYRPTTGTRAGYLGFGATNVELTLENSSNFSIIGGVTQLTSATASTSTTTGALTVAGGLGVAGAANIGGAVTGAGGIVSTSATAGIGYATGAGGAVTQITSRTTGVTINKTSGAITLFTAAGSATAASFTVTNSAVATTDTITISVKSSTANKYNAFVTAVAAGSFEITFSTTGGTTSDAPVFNFNVVKGVAA